MSTIIKSTIAPDIAKMHEETPEIFESTEGQTIIHCSYVSKIIYVNGGWVNIYPTTFLKNRETGDSIQLHTALDIPLGPDKYYFKKAGQMKKFTLLFPATPKSWTQFDFVEIAGSHEGFKISNITRKDSGVYHINLK